MNDLLVIENVNAVEVFNGTGLDDLLDKIRTEAASIVPITDTAKGRKEIASMAAKVSKSKTYLDGLGKELVSDWKTKSKAVDAERKKMRDNLDELKAEVRKPLTDWEAAEAARIENHEADLSDIKLLGEQSSVNWINEPLNKLLTLVGSYDVDDFEEYATDAAKAKDKAITQIKEAIEKRTAYDAEQAELKKLRTESEARAKADAEEKLRIEGENRAKIEAEAKAKAEADRVAEASNQAEREKQAAIQAKEDAEQREKQAKKDAEAKAAAAVEAERERIEQNRINDEIEAKKREANKKHKARINNAIVEALVLNGVSTTAAKDAVRAIAKGVVPHTRISY